MTEQFTSVHRIENDIFYVTAPAGSEAKDYKRVLKEWLWRKEPLRNIGASNIRLIGYSRQGVGAFRHALLEVLND